MPVSISGDGGITGLELGAFEDVSGTPTDNQALTWDAATSQWVPETILDTVNAGIGSNVSFRTGTMSQSVSGGTYVDLSGVYVTITPTSATSKVLVFAQIGGGIEHGSGIDLRINATSGSASPQLLQTYDALGRIDLSFFVGYLMSPATTSAVTYQVQVKKGGVFRYRWSMWAIEVAA